MLLRGMSTSLRRLLLLVVALPGVLALLASLYMLGMEHLEHEPRSFSSAFVWAAETLSSTGYGSDSRWSHPAMVASFTATCWWKEPPNSTSPAYAGGSCRCPASVRASGATLPTRARSIRM